MKNLEVRHRMAAKLIGEMKIDLLALKKAYFHQRKENARLEREIVALHCEIHRIQDEKEAMRLPIVRRWRV